MNIILLSGGSGKRLWPLSNDIRSKQFLKIYKNADGVYESMVQRVHKQIKKVCANSTVTIATSKSQVSSIHNQLDDTVGISVEPCRRDTFPAIALATAYLHDIKGVGVDEAVVICPVDPYVDEDYFKMLENLSIQAQKQEANLVLMGIEPNYPSEKYGYIIPESNRPISKVISFKEKPSQDVAKEYISKGALWNCGVFAFRLKYVLDIAKQIFGTCNYDELFSKYETLEKISFDYAVVEKESNIQVLRFAGRWSDIGSWNTLTEAMSENVIGDAVVDEACENTHIINELDIPILVMGIKDAVVSASSDGILVADKRRSDYIKKYVEQYNRKVMYAEKSWGVFRVIDVAEKSLTIKVTMKANDNMNYHSHEHRDEVWTIVSGKGRTIVDGMEQLVGPGDVIAIQAGCKHTIFSITDLELIEVQLGENIDVNDKKKYRLDI